MGTFVPRIPATKDNIIAPHNPALAPNPVATPKARACGSVIIAAFNPLKYYGHAVRSIYLKGAVFSDMYRELIILGIFAVVLNILAVISYKKNE